MTAEVNLVFFSVSFISSRDLLDLATSAAKHSVFGGAAIRFRRKFRRSARAKIDRPSSPVNKSSPDTDRPIGDLVYEGGAFCVLLFLSIRFSPSTQP